MKKLPVLFFLFLSSITYSQKSSSEGNITTSTVRSGKTEVKSYTVKDTSATSNTEKKVVLRLTATNYPPVTTSVYNATEPVLPDTSGNISSTETVEYYDEMLRNIEIKKEWVRNNPAEHAKALETGWYEQMELYQKEYREAKDKLLNQSPQKEK